MPCKETRGKYADIIREPHGQKKRKHSQKPIAAYEMIEDMFPDIPKIELFARNYRDG